MKLLLSSALMLSFIFGACTPQNGNENDALLDALIQDPQLPSLEDLENEPQPFSEGPDSAPPGLEL